jgi:superkiller protein 3
MAHCYRLLDKKYHIDAMVLYKAILQHYPEQTSALEGVGLILIEEKRFEEALNYFKKVQLLEPRNHKSLAEIGWIYCEQKNYEAAIECIQNALEIAGTDVADYYYRLGRVYWFMEGMCGYCNLCKPETYLIIQIQTMRSNISCSQ